MSLHWGSWEFFHLSRCCFPDSRPVWPLLQTWQQALDEWFTLPLTILQIIYRNTPMLPNWIRPSDDDCTRSIWLMKHLVLIVKVPSWLNLTNDCYHAEVVHDISFVHTRSFSSLQLFNSQGRVMHHRNCDFMPFRSDFSKTSVSLHLLLLWYIDET